MNTNSNRMVQKREGKLEDIFLIFTYFQNYLEGLMVIERERCDKSGRRKLSYKIYSTKIKFEYHMIKSYNLSIKKAQNLFVKEVVVFNWLKTYLDKLGNFL